MSERLNESPEPINGETLQRQLIENLLFCAGIYELGAKQLDEPAKRHAVDQYVQWFTSDADMPLPAKRILLAPSNPDQKAGDIEAVHIYYPTDTSLRDEHNKPRLIFVSTLSTSREERHHLVSPAQFLTFRDKAELEVSLNILDIVDFTQHDPAMAFNFRLADSAVDDMRSADESPYLESLNRAVTTYKLKAQPAQRHQEAS